jgi:hypothetical protein
MSGSQSGYTYGQIIAQARSIMQDQSQPYRYADTELYNGLYEAMSIARVIRPDMFLVVGLDTAPAFLTPASSTLPFPLAWQFTPAFVDFVVFRAESRDDTFTDDSRAQQFLTTFKAQIATPVAP